MTREEKLEYLLRASRMMVNTMLEIPVGVVPSKLEAVLMLLGDIAFAIDLDVELDVIFEQTTKDLLYRYEQSTVDNEAETVVG